MIQAARSSDKDCGWLMYVCMKGDERNHGRKEGRIS